MRDAGIGIIGLGVRLGMGIGKRKNKGGSEKNSIALEKWKSCRYRWVGE